MKTHWYSIKSHQAHWKKAGGYGGQGGKKKGERTTEGFVRRKRRRVILTHRHRVKDTVTLTGHFHTCCLQMLND